LRNVKYKIRLQIINNQSDKIPREPIKHKIVNHMYKNQDPLLADVRTNKQHNKTPSVGGQKNQQTLI
jgi:hypothetical protein